MRHLTATLKRSTLLLALAAAPLAALAQAYPAKPIKLPGSIMSDQSLVRYLGYAELPESEPIKARLRAEQPRTLAEGIHLIVVQGSDGGLIVGDSHHYDWSPSPFQRAEVDDLILAVADGRGAVVTRVFGGSAAATAGLRAGDVITAANGERVDGRDALRNFEGLQAVGSRVTLDVLRDGKPLKLATTLREQPRALPGAELDERLAGATFAELPERLRQAGEGGVLVEAVARGSRAAQNGLQAGDRIVAASTGEFDDLPGFRAGFTRAPAQLVLRVVRGNQRGDLPMR